MLRAVRRLALLGSCLLLAACATTAGRPPAPSLPPGGIPAEQAESLALQQVHLLSFASGPKANATVEPPAGSAPSGGGPWVWRVELDSASSGACDLLPPSNRTPASCAAPVVATVTLDYASGEVQELIDQSVHISPF